mgnify:CR=1 FL=1
MRGFAATASEIVFPRPNFGKDLGFRSGLHPEPRLDLGNVAAQERIGVQFVAQAGGNGGLPRLARGSNCFATRDKRRVLRFNSQREFRVGGGVFMAGINLCFRAQGGKVAKALVCSGVPSKSRPQPSAIRLSAVKTALEAGK